MNARLVPSITCANDGQNPQNNLEDERRQSPRIREPSVRAAVPTGPAALRCNGRRMTGKLAVTPSCCAKVAAALIAAGLSAACKLKRFDRIVRDKERPATDRNGSRW